MSIDTKALKERIYALEADLDTAQHADHEETIRALVVAADRLAALEAELASLRTDRDGAAEQDNARLREDAERWRALRELDGGEIYALLGDYDGIHPEQADAAIDRARGKGIVPDAPFATEQALRKLLATAEENPFCPVGHLVEHGLGGADALRAALSQAAEQHDPLAVSDHCPECSEPEPECACDERIEDYRHGQEG